MLPKLEETPNHQALVVLEHLTVQAVHEIDIFLRQLEGSALEAYATRCILEHESVVNVDHVTHAVEHDISVVSVLHVEKVVVQAVARK